MSYLRNKYGQLAAEVARLKQRRAERTAVVAEPMWAEGTMCTAIMDWINEYRRRFPHPVRPKEVRVIRMRMVGEDRSHHALPSRDEPAPDYDAMDIETLRREAARDMPLYERRKLERALNDKLGALRVPTRTDLTQEQHLALSRAADERAAAEIGESWATTRINDGSLTRH